MEVEIREADLSNAKDADAITRLVDEYARLPIGQGAPLDENVRRELLPGLRRHSGALVFLAWLGDRAVGVAVCMTGFSTFTARPLMNIHDLAVSEDCRGRGVGRGLIEAVEAKARALGCGKVTLEVRKDNVAADRLYRRLGFGNAKGRPATFFLTKTLVSR